MFYTGAWMVNRVLMNTHYGFELQWKQYNFVVRLFRAMADGRCRTEDIVSINKTWYQNRMSFQIRSICIFASSFYFLPEQCAGKAKIISFPDFGNIKVDKSSIFDTSKSLQRSNILNDSIKSVGNTKSSALMAESTVRKHIPESWFQVTRYITQFSCLSRSDDRTTNVARLETTENTNFQNIKKIKWWYVYREPSTQQHSNTQCIQTICNFALGDFYAANF